MGYGFGVFLLAVGLILALAVQDRIDAVDLTMVGWILAGAGVLVVLLTLVMSMSGRSRSTTTYADGTRVDRDHRTPPPA